MSDSCWTQQTVDRVALTFKPSQVWTPWELRLIWLKRAVKASLCWGGVRLVSAYLMQHKCLKAQRSRFVAQISSTAIKSSSFHWSKGTEVSKVSNFELSRLESNQVIRSGWSQSKSFHICCVVKGSSSPWITKNPGFCVKSCNGVQSCFVWVCASPVGWKSLQYGTKLGHLRHQWDSPENQRTRTSSD